MIDYRGGARSDTRAEGKPDATENKVRAVDKDNTWGKVFDEYATMRFNGRLHAYTGN